MIRCWPLLGLVYFFGENYGLDPWLQPVKYNDVEEDVQPRPPPDVSNPYQEVTTLGDYVNAHWQGLLFAGQMEFTWLVDIRSKEESEETWFVGNLITSFHVLTSCHALKQFTNIANLRADFFRQWLYEPQQPFFNSFHKIVDPENFLQGGRPIAYATKHPQCNDKNINFDMSLLTLSREITPYVPRLALMPVPLNQSTGYIAEPGLDLLAKKVCTVGSVGRVYYNDKAGQLVKNYKTRIRAYTALWGCCFGDCYDNQGLDPWKKICGPGVPECQNVPTAERPDMMCMLTRAKVGNVCEHDRGAPVVCNGEVYGIVTRAALHHYCNSVLPLPFIVVRISVFSHFYKGDIFNRNRMHKMPASYKEMVQPGPPARPSNTINSGQGVIQFNKIAFAVSIFAPLVLRLHLRGFSYIKIK